MVAHHRCLFAGVAGLWAELRRPEWRRVHASSTQDRISEFRKTQVPAIAHMAMDSCACVTLSVKHTFFELAHEELCVHASTPRARAFSDSILSGSSFSSDGGEKDSQHCSTADGQEQGEFGSFSDLSISDSASAESVSSSEDECLACSARVGPSIHSATPVMQPVAFHSHPFVWFPAVGGAYVLPPIVGPAPVVPKQQHRHELAEPSEAAKPQCKSVSTSPRTTVMIRNMPNDYTRDMLLDLFDSRGFAGLYDFVYLPIDFDTRACLGYAFINLVDGAAAKRFWNEFDGFSSWAVPTRKVSSVSWSHPHQGYDAHVERYRNRPVMAATVPDEFKPVIFKEGQRVPFPLSTRRVRAPKGNW